MNEQAITPDGIKVGIMQPYFFPYLGYWQLMNAVDRYVVFDDVDYIKSGRINRNAILLNGKSHNINLPILGASSNKHINEIQVNPERLLRKKVMRTLEQNYVKAPYFDQALPIIEEVLFQDETDLGRFLYHSFEIVGAYLGITTELILSSDLKKENDLYGYHKVISICKGLGAAEYYNSVSGIPLYEPHRPEFEAAGIELSFPKMRDIVYPQFKNEFVPNLSIIDVMMFNPREECQRLLSEYDIVKGEDRS